jgi:hypothetical protein
MNVDLGKAKMAEDKNMTDVKLGQKWSTWVPGRQQWLLATVIHREAGRATLQCDARYGIGRGADEIIADESTMLSARNLFRLMEGG